jgi:hypothetical protein
MTPDQVAALTSFAAIISQLGAWPIGSVIAAVIFGPWIIMGFVSRSMEKRFEVALQMYEANVELVENYKKVAAEQADTIRLSTAASVELITWLKTRTPCHERITEKLRSNQ